MPSAFELLQPWLRDAERGRRNWDAALAHLDPALTARFGELLCIGLPGVADPDMALNNLERLLAQPSTQSLVPILLEANGSKLETVLPLLATSQFFADTLMNDPTALPMVLSPSRRTSTTAELTARLRAEVDRAQDDAAILRAFRQFRHRQMLRIGINDIIHDRPLEEITRDLARVADASLEVAVQTAMRSLGRIYGRPQTPGGDAARVACLSFGKLGGDELNYSSDIDLMFVYDEDGETAGKRAASISNAEFFAKVVTEVVRLLGSHTDHGFAYRIDLRLRPGGQRAPLARPLAATLSYYDAIGRTWERQALIKLRPSAGDLTLGREFIAAIGPFIYRKYFSFSEIGEVKALKRQMEARTLRAGTDDTDVKTGRGGIRDIEYSVQFLQLLNGGDLPAVRQRNTLLALEALEIAGCLTPQETYILSDAYRFLRKVEHRLQLLFDWQTHKLPTSPIELNKLARRMGYVSREADFRRLRAREEEPRSEEESGSRATLAPQKRSPLDEGPEPPTLDTRDLLVDPLDQFLKDYHDKTRLDRAILNHLLHQTFEDPDGRSEPEADLILLQDPDEATLKATLGRYHFRDLPAAYQNLSRLAQEEVPFLSHRRCRHFLAGIAPRLLQAIAETPDPDLALSNLERVTASLGAKAVLYELFSFNPPSLKLYVDICANSPYLSAILINNPGMIDDLLDSLILDQPRSAEELRIELAELLRGASDPDPILHSFQDKELLRIAVRDLLGKEEIRQTTAALSDLADTILNAAFDRVEPDVQARFGRPLLPATDRETPRECRYVILGLGKLGGREISYHSDLDLMVVYEGDGTTVPVAGSDHGGTTHFHYFTELAQRVIRLLSQPGPLGRLYAVDMRLRPTGKSGSLVVPLAEFRRYYQSGGGRLWERQALTRTRVLRGDDDFAQHVLADVRQAMIGPPWQPAIADEVRSMRDRLEATAPPRSLKRGPGGLTDVEFLVQLLLLRHGAKHPEILQPNVWDALDRLQATNCLMAEEAEQLREGYSFLRWVEARVRIVTDRPLTTLPEAAADREKLARRLGFEAGERQCAAEGFMTRLERVTREIRKLYHAVTSRVRQEASSA